MRNFKIYLLGVAAMLFSTSCLDKDPTHAILADQSITTVEGVHCLVRQRRTLVYVWVHAHWGTVYDDVMLFFRSFYSYRSPTM